MGQGALILERPEGGRQPVLPAVPELGADADGGRRHRRGGHRLPGRHLRRVLGHPPGGPARLPAAADRAAHRAREIGQVYVPVVNWGIFTAVAALVLGFGSSDHLAAAYGIAVTGTLAIDTLLFFFVVRALWHRPLWLALAGGAFFLTIDLAFFGANLPKVLHGGWFPLVIAADHLHRADDVAERPRDRDGAPARARGSAARLRRGGARARRACSARPRTGVFLNANPDTTPLALRANLEHNHTVHETRRDRLARAAQRAARARRRAAQARRPRLQGRRHLPRHRPLRLPGRHRHPGTAARARSSSSRATSTSSNVSYFISRATISITDDPCMARWRKKLFVAIAQQCRQPGRVLQPARTSGRS